MVAFLINSPCLKKRQSGVIPLNAADDVDADAVEKTGTGGVTSELSRLSSELVGELATSKLVIGGRWSGNTNDI